MRRLALASLVTEQRWDGVVSTVRPRVSCRSTLRLARARAGPTEAVPPGGPPPFAAGSVHQQRTACKAPTRRGAKDGTREPSSSSYFALDARLTQDRVSLLFEGLANPGNGHAAMRSGLARFRTRHYALRSNLSQLCAAFGAGRRMDMEFRMCTGCESVLIARSQQGPRRPTPKAHNGIVPNGADGVHDFTYAAHAHLSQALAHRALRAIQSCKVPPVQRRVRCDAMRCSLDRRG